jgi:polyisoprenoid-binding protein YceI
MTPARLRVLVRVVAVMVVVGVLVGGYGIWYLFFRPSGPAAVGSASLPVASFSGIPTPATADGTWNVDTSLGSMDAGTASFVGYRVQEQLASIGANTAVGRTPDVYGTLTLQRTTVTAVDITANLEELRSDDDRRDNQLRQQALESGQYPTGHFVLTEPIQLGALPQDGQTLSVTAKGNLTIHGVTKAVSIPLKATRHSAVMTVTGSLTITFADYNIQKPTSFFVLSVDDHGIMEFQLHFVHA